MTTVTRIHAHECRYKMVVNGVWISTSDCHFGLPLPINPPGPKNRRAA